MRLAYALVMFSSCSAGEHIAGVVRDGVTGEPVGGTLVVSGADGSTLLCSQLEIEVAANGTFAWPARCAPGSFTMSLGENVWMPPLELRRRPEEIQLLTWSSQPTSGVFAIGKAVDRVPGAARVREEVLLGRRETVRLPDVLPQLWPVIEPGDWLLLAGDGIGRELVPVIASGPRRFGDPDAAREATPWMYLGVAFDDDTQVRPVVAEIEDDRFVDAAWGGLQARWIPHGAIAPGTYAVEASDRRLFLFEVAFEP